MKTRMSSFFLFGVLLQAQAAPPPASREDLMAHVRFLAGDPLAGRETGTTAERLASGYIVNVFKEAGLTPPAKSPGGSYLQSFEVLLDCTLGDGNRLSLETRHGREKGEAVSWKGEAKRDFLPLPGSIARGEAQGEIVFAGYGITAPEHAYDDYAGLDVKGKVVLVLRHEPREKDPKSPFDGDRMTSHATFQAKIDRACALGAAGLVLVDDPLHHPGDAPLEGPLDVSAAGIPAVHARLSEMAPLLSAAGVDLRRLQEEIDRDLKPRSRPLPIAASLAVDVKAHPRTASNVVGILPGGDPVLASEAVVIGAHYDHVGLGHFGARGGAADRGQIHNGADDNASGTAALLELARAFGRPGAPKPRRTLVFVAFTGEELGCLGSRHYVAHPAWPLEKTVAMINMDMVGRSNGQLTVGGVGTGSGLKALVEKAAEGSGLELAFGESGFAPSDNAPFCEKKVPALFFFTRMHADYHRPTDDVEKIDAAGLEAVTGIVFRAATALAEAPRPAYAYVAPSEIPGMDLSGPRLGVTVEAVGQGDLRGCRITAVVPGGNAARAGLQPGDVMTELAGVPTPDREALVSALSRQAYDSTVRVRVVRKGKPFEIETVLRKS